MQSHIISTLFLRLLIMNALNTSRLLSSVPFFFILLSSSHLSLHIYIKWTCLLSPPTTPAAAPPAPKKKNVSSPLTSWQDQHLMRTRNQNEKRICPSQIRFCKFISWFTLEWDRSMAHNFLFFSLNIALYYLKGGKSSKIHKSLGPTLIPICPQQMSIYI